MAAYDPRWHGLGGPMAAHLIVMGKFWLSHTYKTYFACLGAKKNFSIATHEHISYKYLHETISQIFFNTLASLK
jgi:hypothetical protein